MEVTEGVENRTLAHRTEMARIDPSSSDINGWNPDPDELVTVVGAGVAGLACAIVLAQAGRPVIVREWRKTVGSRFHGDFQGLENWSDERDILDELRASGIEIRFDSHPVYESTVFDAWGEAYPVRGERPLYYLIRRGGDDGSLDRGLLSQAVAAGADVRFGDRVTGIDGPAVLAIGPRVTDAIAVGELESDFPPAPRARVVLTRNQSGWQRAHPYILE